MKVVWNKVTWYSWWGAVLFFFFVFPAVSFYIGRYYEGTLNIIHSTESSGGAVVQDSLSSLSTVRWKTHRNFAGQYEARYPSEWMITGYEPTPSGMDVEFRSMRGDGYNFSISTVKSVTESLDTYLKQYDAARGMMVVGSEAVVVGGVTGRERLEQDGQGQYYATYIKRGTTLYILRSENFSPQGFTTTEHDLYRQLVSSFSFI